MTMKLDADKFAKLQEMQAEVDLATAHFKLATAEHELKKSKFNLAVVEAVASIEGASSSTHMLCLLCGAALIIGKKCDCE